MIRSALSRRLQVRPFVLAVVGALLLLPPIEALAFFAATGTGQVTGIQIATASSTVSLAEVGGASGLTYSNGTNLAPGSNVSFTVSATCLTSCPTTVSTVSLQSVSSTKVGCDSTSLPTSFTMPQVTFNGTVNTTAVNVGTATLTFVNLPSTNQDACSGASLTLTLSTP